MLLNQATSHPAGPVHGKIFERSAVKFLQEEKLSHLRNPLAEVGSGYNSPIISLKTSQGDIFHVLMSLMLVCSGPCQVYKRYNIYIYIYRYTV